MAGAVYVDREGDWWFDEEAYEGWRRDQEALKVTRAVYNGVGYSTPEAAELARWQDQLKKRGRMSEEANVAGVVYEANDGRRYYDEAAALAEQRDLKANVEKLMADSKIHQFSTPVMLPPLERSDGLAGTIKAASGLVKALMAAVKAGDLYLPPEVYVAIAELNIRIMEDMEPIKVVLPKSGGG